MARALSTNKEPLEQSPAGRVMDEAIELGIEERSPYPERCTFLNVDRPALGREIWRAVEEDRAVVLVAADCSTRTLLPEPIGR